MATQPNLHEQWRRYQVDLIQRSMQFMDALRERADNMLAHGTAGMPPLLSFAHEMVLDTKCKAGWSCSRTSTQHLDASAG